MSKARLVITAVVREGRSQGEVARACGVSQGWVSRLVARYRAEGEAAFEPRSRRPKTSPNAIAAGTISPPACHPAPNPEDPGPNEGSGSFRCLERSQGGANGTRTPDPLLAKIVDTVLSRAPSLVGVVLSCPRATAIHRPPPPGGARNGHGHLIRRYPRAFRHHSDQSGHAA
jgi:hypothetical protein